MYPALMGLCGVVLGVLLSNVAVRLLEAMRRREKIQDVSTAIRAEIRSHRQSLLAFKEDATGEITQRILDEPGYAPFIPSEGRSFVFDAIVKELHILPTEIIDPVVYYYRQIARLGQFADDLRTDRFLQLDAARKANMYRDYVAMGEHALRLAEQAVGALEGTSVSRLGTGGAIDRRRRR